MTGRGFARRLQYFARRAAVLSPNRLREHATLAQKCSSKPKPVLIADMLWCAVRYEMAFQDYVDWDIHQLKSAERRTWMTHPKGNYVSQRYNLLTERHRFSNKLDFDRDFTEFIGREWLDVRETSVEALREFATRHGRVMAKVPDSLGGKGITSHRAAEISDWAAFRDTLIAGRQWLVEQFVTQHPTMAALNPSSVNTLRIITWYDGTNVTVLSRVLKCGNGADVDNVSQGGMYTMLDERGVAIHAAFDQDNDTFEIHPSSGTPIVGFQVPLFDQVLEVVDRIARVVPDIPYVGWDIAITPDAPIVIEGNYNTGIFQPKPSVSGIRIGQLPLYRATIGF